MSLSFRSQATKEKFTEPECVRIISQGECTNIPKAQLKEDKKFFIFDEFDKSNEAFNYIYTATTVQ